MTKSTSKGKPKAIFSAEFTCSMRILGHLPGMNCIELLHEQVKQLGEFKRARLLCTVNGKVTFSCSVLPEKKGAGYIMFNKKNMKSAGIIPGDIVDISLTPDTSKYGMEMPEELEEVLNQDPEGFRRFEMLTPGKQRNIIHYVSSVKSPGLRIDRALKLIRNLTEIPEGKETFRLIMGIYD